MCSMKQRTSVSNIPDKRVLKKKLKHHLSIWNRIEDHAGEDDCNKKSKKASSEVDLVYERGYERGYESPYVLEYVRCVQDGSVRCCRREEGECGSMQVLEQDHHRPSNSVQLPNFFLGDKSQSRLAFFSTDDVTRNGTT